MIYRVHKTKNYSVISNKHFKDNRLSLKAKGLLSEVLSLPDDWDFSIKGLVAINKENERAITSALDELKEYGYLVIDKIPPKQGNNQFEYVYNFYEEPLDIQNVGLQVVALQNDVQYNTNEKSTKEESTKSILVTTTNVVQKSETKKKMNLYEKIMFSIDMFTQDEKLRETLKLFAGFRLDRARFENTQLYYGVWTGLLNQIKKLAMDDNGILDVVRAEKIVANSLEHGWKNFYDIKENDYNKNYNTKLRVFGETEDVKSVHATQQERDEIERWQLENGIESF